MSSDKEKTEISAVTNDLAAEPVEIEIVPEYEAAVSLDRNPAAVYLATLRPNGRRAMQHGLDVIAGMIRPGANALTLPWHELRFQHTAAVSAALREQYSPATVNQMLSALRGVLRAAETLELMSADDFRRATRVKSVKNETLPKGRALAGQELAALLRACERDQSPAGVRDAAMLVVTYGAGLRRSEVVKLDLSDYNARNGGLTIRGGKGGKDRQAYLGKDIVSPLTRWLALRGNTPGPIFVPVNKGHKIGLGKRMTDQAVLNIFVKRTKEAGIEGFSPHDLRRTFISDLLDAGADIVTVQKLVGHANVTTTARYDRRGEAARQKAANLVKIPPLEDPE
ncbi:MAG TPA: tyrosine-type recombinase/integrase [Chloroflexia bacterium]|nr:tyrosine-type recombinase/integrase [Chloroflexia bacterium]